MTTKIKDLPELAKSELSAWLGEMPWSFWSTFTTRRELTEKSARRSMALVGDILKAEGYDFRIFWAAEPYDTKEGQHLHALIYFEGIEQLSDNSQYFEALRKAWHTAIGDNQARQYHERYNSQLGARYYVAKYISKKLCDYDMLRARCNYRETLRSSRIVPVIRLANGNVMELSKYKAIKSKRLRKQIDKAAKHDTKIFGKIQEHENSYYEAADTLVNVEHKEHKQTQKERVKDIVKQNKKGYEKLYSMRKGISGGTNKERS